MPVAVAAGYAVIVLLFHGTGAPGQVVTLALQYTLAIGGVVAFAAAVMWLVAIVRSTRRGEAISAGAVAARSLADRWRADRGASLWQPLASFVIVMTAFTLFKQTALPAAGFAMGPAIADADRALLGMDAWRMTHALLPSPWMTQAIDLAYHAWFVPMTLGIVLCVFAPPGSALAQRYVLAYVLLWLVQGSLMAYWLPAAGPIYFSHFQAEAGRFSELAARLAEQDAWLRAAGAPGLSALGFQDHLLRLFDARQIGFGGGISAMPSLHNAMAVLFACAARHLSRRAGWAFAGYAVVIWLGSIQLGWHYALDGFVALAATVATWKATGLIYHAAARRAGEEQGPAPLAA